MFLQLTNEYGLVKSVSRYLSYGECTPKGSIECRDLIFKLFLGFTRRCSSGYDLRYEWDKYFYLIVNIKQDV